MAEWNSGKAEMAQKYSMYLSSVIVSSLHFLWGVGEREVPGMLVISALPSLMLQSHHMTLVLTQVSLLCNFWSKTLLGFQESQSSTTRKILSACDCNLPVSTDPSSICCHNYAGIQNRSWSTKTHWWCNTFKVEGATILLSPSLPSMLPLFDQEQNKTPSSLKECVWGGG